MFSSWSSYRKSRSHFTRGLIVFCRFVFTRQNPIKSIRPNFCAPLWPWWYVFIIPTSIFIFTFISIGNSVDQRCVSEFLNEIRVVTFFFLPPPTPPPYPSFFVCFKTKKPKRKREREKWANKTLEDDKNFGGMQVRNWGVAKDLWVGNSRRKHTVRRIFLFWNFLFFESSGFWWRVASAALQTWRETRIKERDRRTWKVLKALKIEMMVLDNTFPRDSAT